MLEEIVYAPGLRVSRHDHDVANFCIALQGSCTEWLGSKTREYKLLTMDFLPPGEMHSLQIHGKALRSFTVELDGAWLNRAAERSTAFNRSILDHAGVPSHLLMKLYSEFKDMDEVSPLAIEGLVLELLAVVARTQTKSKDRIPPRWLLEGREFLRAHFSEYLSLATVSATVGVHEVHFAREFRRHFDCTAGEYVRGLRIEYACGEIMNSHSSLAEIASAAGFSDQSHFSKVFKRITGLTPAQYRTTLSPR
jgi:AraC family transcriptional regulator